jgi:hypothetical protein
MFEKFKTFISGIGYIWKYGDIIRNFSIAWTRFPGWDDSELLRIWVRPLIQDVSILTTLTKTPIDDIIATAAVRIVDNNSSWVAVYALSQLVRDGLSLEGTLIPSNASHKTTVDEIVHKACPECPAAGLAALGMLLYLLQKRG